MKSVEHVESLITELRREYLEARKLANHSARTVMPQPVADMGKVIRATRKQQGQTLQELADLSGVGYATLSRIENGRTDVQLATVSKILNALGLRLWID